MGVCITFPPPLKRLKYSVRSVDNISKILLGITKFYGYLFFRFYHSTLRGILMNENDNENFSFNTSISYRKKPRYNTNYGTNIKLVNDYVRRLYRKQKRHLRK